MAKYRTLRTDFWADPYVETMRPENRLLYLYLITGPHTNNLGLSEVSHRRLAFESGLSAVQVAVILDQLEVDGKVVRDGDFVWLTKFIKHQTSTSPKMLQGLRDLVSQVDSAKIRGSILDAYPYVIGNADKDFQNSDTTSSGSDTDSKGMDKGMDRVSIGCPELELELELLNTCAKPLKTSHDTQGSQPTADALKSKPLAKARCVSASDFEEFYAAYPKRKSKGQALKAWNSIPEPRPTITQLLSAIAAAKAGQDWQKQGGQFIPYPATWLRARGWEDEEIQPQGLTAGVKFTHIDLDEFKRG